MRQDTSRKIHLRRTGERTLLEVWPEPRSTNDLDLFLRPELLIESEKLKPLAEALHSLRYKVVPSAKHYQFMHLGPDATEAGSIKIDILTGPRSHFAGTKVRADRRRAKPTPSVGIHAHPVDEALSLEDGLLSTTLAGSLSSGDAWETEVLLPNPCTFALMKLFSFRDRLNDENKEFGRYHVLVLYTILATTTEPEWEQALKLKIVIGNPAGGGQASGASSLRGATSGAKSYASRNNSLKFDYSPLLAAGRKSNWIKILTKEKVRCFRPSGLKQKFRNTLQLAAGIEILAFRFSATSSRQIKSFHDFILQEFFEILFGEPGIFDNPAHCKGIARIVSRDGEISSAV